MLGNLLKKVVGSKNERELNKLWPKVDEINALEPQMSALTDAELAALTPAFRERLQNGESLDDLLPEAFAAVREAARRTIGQRHFDVQLIGGMVLHEGKIAEMKTGEGKTLAATLPVYLNALTGRGVHVVTVNDYLAKRDAEWMGAIYRFMGLSVGCILHGLDDAERKEAYGADVTYGTNNEFGFDYLRDNMKFQLDELVQREFYYAIVDEVDSILIDEARTPLIISGPAEKSTQLYQKVDRIIPRLAKNTHYSVDEKSRTANLTDEGRGGLRKDPARGQPLRPALHGDFAPHTAGAQGPHPFQARRRLHREKRRGHHRRRVHRPPHARPALLRGPAPGLGGQGKASRQEREPDPGHHHLSELFPHVRQAGGHDRHRRHRGRGVPQDLQVGSHGGAHAQAHDPQ